MIRANSVGRPRQLGLLPVSAYMGCRSQSTVGDDLASTSRSPTIFASLWGSEEPGLATRNNEELVASMALANASSRTASRGDGWCQRHPSKLRGRLSHARRFVGRALGSTRHMPVGLRCPHRRVRATLQPPVISRFLPVATLVVLSIGAWPAATGSKPDVSQALRPFCTDDCSIGPDLDFGDCCVAHDYLYWKGGTAAARAEADRRLLECIRDRSEWPALGFVYYVAVRAGGHESWHTAFRWGFGWPYSRAAKPLLPVELAQVRRRRSEYLTEHGNACREGDGESCRLLKALADVLDSEVEAAYPLDQHLLPNPGKETPGELLPRSPSKAAKESDPHRN